MANVIANIIFIVTALSIVASSSTMIRTKTAVISFNEQPSSWIASSTESSELNDAGKVLLKDFDDNAPCNVCSRDMRKYPFLTSMKNDRYDTDDKKNQCKAIIVSRSYILTGRSCSNFDSARYEAFVDTVNENGHPVRLEVIRFFPYPYPRSNGTFDHVLAQLNESFVFSKYVQPLLTFSILRVPRNRNAFEATQRLTDIGKFYDPIDDDRSSVRRYWNAINGRANETGVVLFGRHATGMYYGIGVLISSWMGDEFPTDSSNLTDNELLSYARLSRGLDKMKVVEFDREWIKTVVGEKEIYSNIRYQINAVL